MKISVKERNNFQIFLVDGEIAPGNVDQLEKFIFDNLHASSRGAALRFDHQSSLSSTVIGALVRIQKTIKARGIKLGIITTDSVTISIFKIIGIADQFPFYRNEDDIPQ